MQITKQLSLHLHQVFFGGNWTWSNLKDQLEGVTWQQATQKTNDLNTILALTYHIYYYVEALLKVVDGKPLDSKDKYSFDHPLVASENDWEEFKAKVFDDVTRLTEKIAEIPDSDLDQTFVDPKYGHYHRNLLGLIEHTHYHLGQIAIIKKMIIKK